jgi:hypothetical protein
MYARQTAARRISNAAVSNPLLRPVPVIINWQLFSHDPTCGRETTLFQLAHNDQSVSIRKISTVRSFAHPPRAAPLDFDRVLLSSLRRVCTIKDTGLAIDLLQNKSRFFEQKMETSI